MKVKNIQHNAVNISHYKSLVALLQSTLKLSVYVETRAIDGYFLVFLLEYFEEIHSVELSINNYQEAVTCLEQNPRIQLHPGKSALVLRHLSQGLTTKGVIYFLRAHKNILSDSLTAQASQNEILLELQAIGKLNKKSVLFINGLRFSHTASPLLQANSQWRNFHRIVEQLLIMSAYHEFMVIDDLLIFFPTLATSAVESYSQKCEIDSFSAVYSLKENFRYQHILEKTEAIVKEQEKTISALQEQVLSFNKQLSQMSRALHAYRLAYGGLSPLRLPARILRRTYEIFAPRLGWLNQYEPRPMSHHVKQIKDYSKKLPYISIVTPSYEQGDYIERTIQSVLNQGYPNLQYFVKDGGSTDSTISVLKRYEDKLSGWVSEKDSGQSEAINFGFDNTDGEIMAWINSDDLLLPGTLQYVVDYFNSNPDVDVVYGNRLMIDKNDMEIGRWLLPGHDVSVLLWVDYIPQETLFWRRRIWEKVGGKIDESFRFAMDWEILLRFASAGAKFGHINKFLGAFRIHDLQKTSLVISNVGEAEMNLIRKRNLGIVPSRSQILWAVMPYLIKHIVIDLFYRIKIRLERYL